MKVNLNAGFLDTREIVELAKAADELGSLNQRLARCCESVVLVVAGLVSLRCSRLLLSLH